MGKRVTVLVTGGTGLIGRALCPLLTANGYDVRLLSRAAGLNGKYRSYHWNVENGEMDFQALDGADHIIHLAGANIGEKRWTEARKALIRSSRTDAATLLAAAVSKYPGKIKTFLGASAVGYYGAHTSAHIFTEADPPASDFLGTTCAQWEASSLVFEELGCRRVLLRTGVVLSREGGIIPALKPMVKWGMGAVAGTGSQYLPWIHIEDLCRLYLFALRTSGLHGAFNAVAPEDTDYRTFIHTMARIMGRRILLPAIPGSILKVLLGEMSQMVLYGSRVSASLVMEAGFAFNLPVLSDALGSEL